MYFSIHSTASLNVEVLLAFIRRPLYWKYGFMFADSIHALKKDREVALTSIIQNLKTHPTHTMSVKSLTTMQ